MDIGQSADDFHSMFVSEQRMSNYDKKTKHGFQILRQSCVRFLLIFNRSYYTFDRKSFIIGY